jgi:hypothetical protein
VVARPKQQSEADLMRLMMVEASTLGARLWRNNVGQGLTVRGQSPQHREQIIKACQELAVKLGGSAARIQYGLAHGSGDLVGFVQHTVTPADVGRQIPVFAAPEVKTKTGRSSPEQLAWARFINSSGGAAGELRSIEELREFIARHR